MIGAVALLAGVAAAPASAPVPVAAARPGQVVDLASDFARFADETASMPSDARVAAFHQRYDSVVPGYYRRDGKAQAQFDTDIARGLAHFPADRGKFVAAIALVKQAFPRGEAHFRRFFPDYRLSVPVYLVQSFGTQDGGTREIGGRTVLFFGADVIADIHDATTIGPFLDHELFHVYHQRFFKGCDQLWCNLWSEGLAVYVAARASPGASDRALLLTQPRPIRPAVEPRLREAMCRLRAKFDSTDAADLAEFFQGGTDGRPFPSRYGYLLGYILAQRIGEHMPLASIARLPNAAVRALLLQNLASYGPCTVQVGAPR